jgi:hypothetical protein
MEARIIGSAAVRARHPAWSTVGLERNLRSAMASNEAGAVQ